MQLLFVMRHMAMRRSLLVPIMAGHMVNQHHRSDMHAVNGTAVPLAQCNLEPSLL